MLTEWLKPILFIVGYVVLMRWVLPALGVPTCMSGACRIPKVRRKPGAETDPHREGPVEHV